MRYSPPPHLLIRKGQEKDAEIISALIKRNIYTVHGEHYTKAALDIWARGYSLSAIERHIQEQEVFVLEHKQAVCGTIQLDRDHREIKGFYLDPQIKDRGLGSLLFCFMLSHLKMLDYDWVELSSNPWTVPFYEKHNFKIIKKDIVTWEGQPYEEWRMRRCFNIS